MKTWIFVIIVFVVTTAQVNAEIFSYEAAGISFDIGSLKYDDKNSHIEPLSLVFQAGEHPFYVSVLFKIESKNQTLNDFMVNEKSNQIKRGYSDEMSIYKLNTVKYNSVEYVRNSPMGLIHWFVFQKVTSNQIYSFWFLETKGLQAENQLALSAYTKMKSTVK